MKLILFVLMILLSVAMASATVSEWTYEQITDDSGNDINIDIAIDSNDVIHRVYERDGSIYYSNSLDDVEKLVGAGTNPAIAVGVNNEPQVVFLDNGNWNYAKFSGNSWSYEYDINSANWVDIDVDSNNFAHIVFSGNYDGGGYNDIVYVNNLNGSFVNVEIADGWYYDHTGYYYYYPSIKLDSEGYYYVSLIFKAWGGQASWSNDYVSVLTNSVRGGSSSSDYPYNSIGLNRNSIAIDDSDNVHVVFTYGSIYHADVYPWNNTFLAIGSNPAIDAKDKVAVVYDYLGGVYYSEDTGLGFSSPLFIDSGTNPVIALGSVNIDYLQSEEVFEAYKERNDGNPQIPEFGIVAAGVALIGAVAIFAFKRK